MGELAGTWKLRSWAAVWTLEFEGATDEFLYQDPADPLARAEDTGEVRGSMLSISPGGDFSQAGECDCPVLTYDENGVQVSGVAEFGGSVRVDGGRGYLLNGTPARVDAGRQRYDDGDTRVCDSARVVDGRLVRTICVVTDDLYGDRIVLTYDRA